MGGACSTYGRQERRIITDPYLFLPCLVAWLLSFILAKGFVNYNDQVASLFSGEHV
jgi:hypothetical protein